MLADFHLGDSSTGLELVQRVAKRLLELRGTSCAAVLITADHGMELTRAARKAGIPLLHKPVRPAALRALLSAFKSRLTRGSAA
jgi:CheY-like chemotaxis protein